MNWNLLLLKSTTKKKKSNIIVGVIRHPSIEFTNFNPNYLNKLLDNISKEQK